MIMTNNLYWLQLQNLAGIFIMTHMIIFIFDGEIIDNNKRALNALIELDYIGLLDQLHYMKEVPRRPTKTETSKYYQISG